MAQSESLRDQISHFQRKLEKYARNGETDKVLYYIHKLKHLHVTVKHLEETGVGRSVNSLRHNGGLVGEKARDLVTKWKMMVSAEEEEEEEEEEHEANEEDECEKKSDEDSGMDLGEQNGEEAEDDEEDDRLQIQEEETEERSIPEYKPGGSSMDGYGCGNESPGGGSDNSYNPLTSQMDYQLLNAAETSGEYHPSVIGSSYAYDSSPEGAEISGWEDELPSVSPDRQNGSSSKSSSKKSNKVEKEKHNKKKEKERSKDRHKEKESSEGHGKEKKRDNKDKHKDRHKEKEEKKEKYKGHKHKDKDRNGEKSREKKSEETSEKIKAEPEKEKKKELMNGYGTPDSRYKSPTIKHVKENNKREVEEKHKKKTSSHRKEERSRNKENRERERESSDSEYIREKDSSSSRESKEKEKHKHRDQHSSSSKTDKVKHDSKNHENQRENDDADPVKMENKKKKSKGSKEEDCDFGAALMGFDSPLKKKKKKKKKDRKERESSDDEKPSVSKSTSHKRALSESAELPESKKPRMLDSLPHNLPKLPMAFSDAALESPLLPEINPNYKPLPRVPLRDERPNQALDKMSEEETFNIMMQSKNSRRGKMYSGRITGLQSVPTLKQCCIKVMIDYIDAIEYTGNVPYDILKSVLDRATPTQLLNIENFNPYLLEDTDEIWEVHCRRDFRKEKRDDMESWRDVYLRCFDAREKKLKSLTENLQQKFISKAEPRRQTKLAFVNTAVKVPKSVLRAQVKHGTGVASGSIIKPGKTAEVAARKIAMHNAQRAEKTAAAPRPTTAKNKKVAPLMAKTRQFYKKAFRR